MGSVIKNNRSVSEEIRLSEFNLEDIQQEAKRIRTEALEFLKRTEQEAEEIISEAKKQAELIYEEARKEGFKAGFEEGMNAGKEAGRKEALEISRREFSEQAANLRNLLLELVDSIQSDRNHLIARARQELLALAVAIAAKITRRQIEVDEGIVIENLKKAIEYVSSRSRVVIRLNPADASRLKTLDPQLSKDLFEGFSEVRFVEDSSIQPGGCIVQTEGGTIDADIKTQIDSITNQLVSSMKEFVEDLAGMDAGE